jgi:hypothetical protein
VSSSAVMMEQGSGIELDKESVLVDQLRDKLREGYKRWFAQH